MKTRFQLMRQVCLYTRTLLLNLVDVLTKAYLLTPFIDFICDHVHIMLQEGDGKWELIA